MNKLRQARSLVVSGGKSLASRQRRAFTILLHVLLVVASSYLAFLLRFDGNIPASQLRVWAVWVPLLVAVRSSTFRPFGLYHGIWRYVSIWDARNIVAAVASSSLVFYVLVRWAFGVTAYPRSVHILDTILLITLLGGLRAGRRLLRDARHSDVEKTILVFGAGDAGAMIVGEMRNSPFYQYRPVGFVDDDPAKQGAAIHGVPVLGGRHDIDRILALTDPDELLIAIPSARPTTIREIVRALEPYKIPIRTLPCLRDLIGGRVEVSQIRNLSIEDLLTREPVDLHRSAISALIAGKRVLVTGAGGSIGSELSRQILALRPAELLLLERYENGLYEISSELDRAAVGVPIRPIVADICDANRVNGVFAAWRPQVVFHAAAHKHVPMMELNPCEAVKNNVLGTRCVARAADRFGVERFVMISTDKAVNPTSVMGVTKRVAEFVVQGLAARSQTAFVTVRFGNVLGSNGSVVPLFLEQIKAGGPVTVTHPEMRRFFMLIPEAVALVLHAAALARGAEIFVLEMGDQIRVADLARNLIRLAGYVPDRDIEVKFTGVRRGEKLYEELVGPDETVEQLKSERMMRVRPVSVPRDLESRVSELGRAAARGATASVMDQLRAIVPTFQSPSSPEPVPASFGLVTQPVPAPSPAPLPAPVLLSATSVPAASV